MAAGTRRFLSWPRSWALSWPALWLAAVAVELLAGGVLVWLAGRHGPALAAVLVNSAVALRFWVTLRRGRVPLITRYARCDAAGLPAHGEAYTRRLTAAWAWLLAGFALLHGLAMLGWWTTATLSLLQSAACVALFLGEHAWRGRILPELGRATPWRTVRAVLAYHGT